jgi:AraC-like DNA-binding protein
VRPFFERVTIPAGASWSLLDRRLDNGIPFQWHYHPEFELTLTLNSRGQRYIGDAIANYDDGDLVLLGPNLPHTWCSAERIAPCAPTPCRGHLVHRSLGDERHHGAGGVAGGPAHAGARLARPRLLARGVGAGATNHRSHSSRCGGGPPAALMKVLTVLAADPEAAPIAGPAAERRKLGSPDRDRIERVLDLLHAHYRDRIAIEALADVAALSVSGFHRLFRRHTRLTVSDYIAELRIGEACALLVNSRKPIASIADEVGYASLANFNRQFRALKGLTPREFRRSFAR